jgi:hypothetical protein
MEPEGTPIKEQNMTYSSPRRWSRLATSGAAAALASLALASSAMADQPSNPGTFVIGDQNAQVGSQVTFWGAQWWKDNPLSTGTAPASFKGFAVNAAPTCGPWSTDPGNSSHPPAAVPGTIQVIVSSQITKDGPVISGNATEIATVQVDPGYAGDPGHPGTGTVLSVTPCGDGSGGGTIFA